MGAKTFKTSKAPTNRVKGGLDAITSQGIYNTGSGKKGRRQNKKRKNGIDSRGGDSRVQNAWSITPAGCKASTVVKAPTKMDLVTRIEKQKVVLFDETTYSASMLKSKNAEPVVNHDKAKTIHKTKSQTSGYMASKQTNGRRVLRNKVTVR